MDHVLVVDDEPAVRSVLRDGLEHAGFIVCEASDLEGLEQQLERNRVDLVTLDLGLAKEDGLAIAQSLRTRCNVPIIMISGRDSTEDRIAGLECGADDYISKPFSMREVVLRVRRVLGRNEPVGSLRNEEREPGRRFRCAAGTLDLSSREFLDGHDRPVGLTDAEFELLAILLRNPQRILSRDELMQMLRGRHWSPNDRTLDKYVAQLRRKIEPQGAVAPVHIKTVRNVGYLFAGRVTTE
ncbi:MAG: response regulator transcription factor [Hyphomicrobiaceae bacterium]